MQVTAIKTHKITEKDTDILAIIDRYLDPIALLQDDKRMLENSVLAVTSKIIAICEGRIVPVQDITKDELVDQEAEWYLPRSLNKYDFSISIKWNTFTASGGVDESNGDGNFVLWPKNPQESANTIREHLVEKFGLKNIGVIITDSKTSPLRWGVTGVCLAHSGFAALKSYVGEPDIFGRKMKVEKFGVKNIGVIITDSKTSPLRWGVTGVCLAHSGFAALKSYIGEPDIFGRKMKVEKLSVMDTLAAASVGVMGEGDEQTPLALITDIPFVSFQDRNPTIEELKMLHIEPEDDLFGHMITSVKWIKGKGENPYT